MNSVVISKDDFKNIHNALCRLDSIYFAVTDVLNSDISEEILNIKRDINSALADAYQQEDRNWAERREHYDAMADQLNIQESVWCLYEVDDFNNRHNFDSVTALCYQNVTVPIAGNNWFHLWIAAETAIVNSGDLHHVYIERFIPDGNNTGILHLQTGS